MCLCVCLCVCVYVCVCVCVCVFVCVCVCVCMYTVCDILFLVLDIAKQGSQGLLKTCVSEHLQCAAIISTSVGDGVH